MAETQEKKVNPVKSLLTGGLGGICNVLVGHPLDTIKVRLQTMPKPEPGQKPMYRGTFDCAAKTIKNEGVQGLYKGMSAPLTGVVPIFAVSFASYNLAKRLQQKENHKLTYWQIFISGAFSGIVTMFIMAPGERIKCLLQVQQGKSGPKKYNGMMHCAKVLYKEGGIRSIYKGSCATLLRDMPSTGMYFFTYEFLQDMARKRYQSDDVGVYSSFFAGGAAGMSFWILGMPADVLKSRLQTSPEGKYPNGVRGVFKELIREDGVMALYRGVAPVMIRAFPANAACFFGIELGNKFFKWIAPNF